MESTVKLHSLRFGNTKTYWFALLFVAGNILLPRLCHSIPQGGAVFLPIYFFTLIAAYKYGIRVGLLTALLSPLTSHLLFGMPPVAVLPLILVKSSLLAVAAVLAADRFKGITIPALLLVVLAYQIAGTAFEWLIVKDFRVAVQDFRLGVPGMLMQVFGGYAVLKAIAKI